MIVEKEIIINNISYTIFSSDKEKYILNTDTNVKYITFAIKTSKKDTVKLIETDEDLLKPLPLPEETDSEEE